MSHPLIAFGSEVDAVGGVELFVLHSHGIQVDDRQIILFGQLFRYGVADGNPGAAGGIDDVRGAEQNIDGLFGLQQRKENLFVMPFVVLRGKMAAVETVVEQNGITALNNTDETMEIAADGAKAMDMKPYYLYRQKNMAGNLENVGFAKEGKDGIYNVLIMEEHHTILALGSGGSTKFNFAGTNRLERVENVKSVKDYISRIDEMIGRKQEFLQKFREYL